MPYGSDTWNQNIIAKNYKYVGTDKNGFLHGSNSTKNLESILNSYNSAIDYSVVNSFKNTVNEDFLNSAKSINDANNAKYEQYFNQANEFNSAEAQKNRDWQEQMSNTAHQREVEDLKKAGLNPVLSANAGASVGSGATASSAQGQVDTSLTSSLASIYNTMLNNATALKQTQMNNDVQRYITNAQVSNARDVANIQAMASMFGASTAASASRYSTDIGATKNPLSFGNQIVQNNKDKLKNYLENNLGLDFNASSGLGIINAKDYDKQIYSMSKEMRNRYGVKLFSGKSSRKMRMMNSKY